MLRPGFDAVEKLTRGEFYAELRTVWESQLKVIERNLHIPGNVVANAILRSALLALNNTFGWKSVMPNAEWYEQEISDAHKDILHSDGDGIHRKPSISDATGFSE